MLLTDPAVRNRLCLCLGNICDQELRGAVPFGDNILLTDAAVRNIIL